MLCPGGRLFGAHCVSCGAEGIAVGLLCVQRGRTQCLDGLDEGSVLAGRWWVLGNLPCGFPGLVLTAPLTPECSRSHLQGGAGHRCSCYVCPASQVEGLSLEPHGGRGGAPMGCRASCSVERSQDKDSCSQHQLSLDPRVGHRHCSLFWAELCAILAQM